MSILTSEEDIIRACAHGQRHAQEWIYNQYKDQFMGMCRRYCKSREQAQDVLQESFVKIFTGIKSYSAKGSFAGWMSRIVINTAIKSNSKWENRRKNYEPAEYEVAMEDASALENLSLKELLSLIEQLPTGCRTVFNLYVIDGFTHEEVAEMLNISAGTSKSQLARAKKLLLVSLSAWKAKENNYLSL